MKKNVIINLLFGLNQIFFENNKNNKNRGKNKGMKANKTTTKIVLSSVLATALIGAGAVKMSQDSNEYIEVAKHNRDSRAVYDGNKGGVEYGSGYTEKLNQTIDETIGTSSNWWEYKFDKVVRSGSSDQLDTGNDAYIAMNYSLINNDSEDPITINGITPEQYYAIGLVFDIEKHGNGSTGWTVFKEIFDNPYSSFQVDASDAYQKTKIGLGHRNDDGVTPADVNAAGHNFTSSTYNEKTTHYMTVGKTRSNISEEDWHTMFDNDEMTLFGATEYNPAAHHIIYFPVTDLVGDPNPNDSFGLTPAAHGSTTNNSVYAKAASKNDILAIASAELYYGKSSDWIKMSIGTSAGNIVGDKTPMWDALSEGAMELSYPKPEFTITPLGYNERNQFEVDVVYNHVAIPAEYDMITEINYTMMGPEAKDSLDTDEKVVWDSITIDDEKLVREHRTSIDDSTLITDTYMFNDPSIPDEIKKWNDGDLTNGGQVDINENPVANDGTDPLAPGAETVFGPDYIGDMEFGSTSAVHSTIKYDGLFYGDGDDDLGKQYQFSNSITLAPTALGSDNAYMIGSPIDTPTVYDYPPVDFIIQPGAASPTIDHFDVIRPTDINSVDPIGTMDVEFSGDTKSIPEDTGVGLRPSYLNQVQVFAQEVDASTGLGVGDEFAISDLVVMDADQAILNSADGAFSGTIETNAGALAANRDYNIYLKAYYGTETYPADPTTDPATMVAVFNLEGEYSTIHTKSYGDRDVVVSNNVVVYDEASNTATLTFDYKQTLPSTIPAGGTNEIGDYSVQEIVKAEVVNNAGTPEETIIYNQEIPAGFDSATDQTGLSITVPTDSLLPNKTHNLSVRLTTAHDATATTNAGDQFITAPIGPYAPVIGGLKRVNEVELAGGEFNSDFQFNIKQQLGDGIDVSAYSESLISKITFVLTDVTNAETLIDINTTDNADKISIPATDSEDITISGTDIDGNPLVFNSTTEYSYSITIDWADAANPVVAEGPISFNLNGVSELDTADVVMTEAHSTLTTVGFDVEINDVEITPSYDSYYVKSLEILDENGAVAENAKVQWIDTTTGDNIDQPVDTAEGVEFSGKASVFISNLEYGTDLTQWSMRIVTDSVNEVAGGDAFETTYNYNLLEKANEASLVDSGNLTGSADSDKEFMDVEPVLATEFEYLDDLTTQEKATFDVTFDDTLGVMMPGDISLTDKDGNIYKQTVMDGETVIEEGNLVVSKLDDDSAREAGLITYRFEITNLEADTEYSGFSINYSISEQVLIDGVEETSKTAMNSTLPTDLVVNTLPVPDESSFPWWIIILLILLTALTAGIVLLVLFLLMPKVKVVETTEINKGSATVILNQDDKSEFAASIKGRTLKGTQNGESYEISYTNSINEFGEIEMKLTGLKSNDVPVKGLVFLADGSEDSKDIKVGGSVDTEILTKPTSVNTEGTAKTAVKFAKKEVSTQKNIIKRADKTIKTSDEKARVTKAEQAKKQAEGKLEVALKDLEKANEQLKEFKGVITATARKI